MEDSLDSFAVDSDSLPFASMLDVSQKENVLEEPKSPFEWDHPSLSPMSESEIPTDDIKEACRIQLGTLGCNENRNYASHDEVENQMEDISENEDAPYDKEGIEDDEEEPAEVMVQEAAAGNDRDQELVELEDDCPAGEYEENQEEKFLEEEEEYEVLDEDQSEETVEQGQTKQIVEETDGQSEIKDLEQDQEDIIDEAGEDLTEMDDAEDVAEQIDAEDVAEQVEAEENMAELINAEEDMTKHVNKEDDDGGEYVAEQNGEAKVEQDDAEDVTEQNNAEVVDQQDHSEVVEKKVAEQVDNFEQKEVENIPKQINAEDGAEQGNVEGDVFEQVETESVAELVETEVSEQDNAEKFAEQKLSKNRENTTIGEIPQQVETEKVVEQGDTGKDVKLKECERDGNKILNDTKVGGKKLINGSEDEHRIKDLNIDTKQAGDFKDDEVEKHDNVKDSWKETETNSTAEHDTTKNNSEEKNVEWFKDELKEVTVQKLELDLRHSKEITGSPKTKCTSKESTNNFNKIQNVVKSAGKKYGPKSRKRKGALQESSKLVDSKAAINENNSRKRITASDRENRKKLRRELSEGKSLVDERFPNRRRKNLLSSTASANESLEKKSKRKVVTFHCDQSAKTNCDIQLSSQTPTFHPCSVRIKPLSFSSRLCKVLLHCSVYLHPLPGHLVPATGHVIKLPQTVTAKFRQVSKKPKRIENKSRHKEPVKIKIRIQPQAKSKRSARQSKKIKSAKVPAKIKKVTKTRSIIAQNAAKTIVVGKRKTTSPYRSRRPR